MASETPSPVGPGPVRWPDRGQILRQCGILAVVALAWSGVFYGAMRLPSSGGTERNAAAEARRDARRAAATGDSTPSRETVAAAEPDSGGAWPDEDAPSETARAAEAVRVDAAARDPVEPTPAPEIPPPPTADRTAQAAPSSPAAAAAPPPPPTPLDAPARGDVPLEELTLDPLDGAEAPGEELGDVSFAADVFPILERRCVKCHGGLRDDGTQRLEEGLSLLTVDAILAGSTWGSVLEPGDVTGSYLYELIEEGDMPDNEPRLLPRELRLIAAWIRAGAPNN